MDFVGALEAMCGYSAPPPVKQTFTKPAEPSKPFKLPEASRCTSAVVGYLQDRGIDPELLGVCMEAGILYESRRYQNCVFVGRDMQGNARTASRPDCPRLAVAESPIDALSLATLVKLSGGNLRDSHYLSLGGTGPRALIQFLHDHPHVTQISLCLDNDKAGLKGIERLTQEIQNDIEIAGRVKRIYPNPPKLGKDYNEFLCTHVKATRTEQRQRDGAR